MALPELSALAALSLFAVGFLAGVMNALAGGGTFVSFPVFMAMGLPPVVANASSAVACGQGTPWRRWPTAASYGRSEGISGPLLRRNR